MIKKSLIFILILGAFSSCTPEPLLIEIDPVEPKPVVWTQVIPGNILTVYFARSFSALEYSEDDSTDVETDLLEQFLVTDGEVILEHNNIMDTLNQIETGLFASFETELIVGDEYTLFLEDYTIDEKASSTTTLLETIPLDENFDYEYHFVNEDQTDLTVYYSFEDPPGDNWYLLNFYSTFNDPFESEDPFSADGLVQNQILSDQTFESSEYNGDIRLSFIDSDTVFVSLSNISEEYYNYLSLRDRGGSILNQITSEPINYPSNVNNGHGFFNLTLPSFRTLIAD